ncbi:glutathione S-transferase C-terminal domain-containing protein homolog isoform X2 [Folsomia candida]|uniref:glutathione S-transferase C-terminal domain-containing protein homolog isoform X2 n=1 Tax=Folsomia candida TaxID=158441 RepID=UPI001604B790|nr:glutathione S-transferase C-terminal domain-containing protein homolog isoform X2 [Folsomia candida]
MKKNNKEAKEEFYRQTKGYFDSIQSKPILRLPVYSTKHLTTGEWEIILPPQSCDILWIYEVYQLFKWIEVAFVRILPCKIDNEDDNSCDTPFNSLQTQISYQCKCDPIVKMLQSFNNCDGDFDARFRMYNFASHRLVVLISEKQWLISGLSSILRFMIKFAYMKLSWDSSSSLPSSTEAQSLQEILGFRGGCLQACSEVSVWTKFCEVDIFEGLEVALNVNGTKNEVLSRELLRFECHLKMPVKMHNIRKEISNKRRQQEMSQTIKNDKVSPIEIEHKFAEGPRMLLSDLILYPCICLFHLLYGSQTCEKYFPNIYSWYSTMNERFHLSKNLKLPGTTAFQCRETGYIWKIPCILEESLYKSDRSRYNPNSRVFTKQHDVLDALAAINLSNIKIKEVTDVVEVLNWEDIPTLAQPEGGNLPPSRREKKNQQLSSMTVEVMKIVEAKSKQHNSTSSPIRIVDFCSGGGHLGILLAFLLPNCQIVLVENKEESLRRAGERIDQLKLTNVLLYQCNLDYYFRCGSSCLRFIYRSGSAKMYFRKSSGFICMLSVLLR